MSGRRDTLPQGTTLDGRLTIESFLGDGGFGYTYGAKDKAGEDFAIKECFPKTLCRRNGLSVGLKSASNEQQVKRVLNQFRVEASALSSMDHHNIVGGGEIIEENGTLYLVMKYLRGRHLTDLRRRMFLAANLSVLLSLTKDLLSALEHIHGQGFLHNDISPENIIVVGGNRPVLIDFGTCTKIERADQEQGADELIVVKPGYSPPEFYCSTVEKSRQSDIYQLGAALFHAVTRVRPPESMIRLSHVARGERDPMNIMIEKGRPDHIRFLESLGRATTYDAADRFETATEWRTYLDQ